MVVEVHIDYEQQERQAVELAAVKRKSRHFTCTLVDLNILLLRI